MAWYLTDAQGSVRVVASSTMTPLDTITYDGFGNITGQTNAAESGRYLYTGREWDKTLGLQDNRARWYDPKTGRWIAEDPWKFKAGDTNLDRYVGNSPTNATDPSGKFLVVATNQAQGIIDAFAKAGAIVKANPITGRNGTSSRYVLITFVPGDNSDSGLNPNPNATARENNPTLHSLTDGAVIEADGSRHWLRDQELADQWHANFQVNLYDRLRRCYTEESMQDFKRAYSDTVQQVADATRTPIPAPPALPPQRNFLQRMADAITGDDQPTRSVVLQTVIVDPRNWTTS